jgi:hypothetical protein
VEDQPGKAALAAATALSTSATVQQGASAIASPVLEFVTGINFVVVDSRHSLFTQYLNRFGFISSLLERYWQLFNPRNHANNGGYCQGFLMGGQ